MNDKLKNESISQQLEFKKLKKSLAEQIFDLERNTFEEHQNIVHTNINSNKKSFLMTNSMFQEKIDY